MKRVLLLFGGESAEREVSVMSAHNVYAAIDRSKFDVTLCYVDESGRFLIVDDIDKLDDGREVLPVLGRSSFRYADSNELIKPDVLLPMLHGRGGEDGAVQGLAQLMHIPVVGCNVEASAVCMNKIMTKRILKSVAIDTVPFVTVFKNSKYPRYDKLKDTLGESMFVKSARQGSSIGVSRATNQAELGQALETAFKYDDTALIEQAIDGREFEVAVLGNYPDIKTSDVAEVLVGGFFNYDLKYSEGSSAETVLSAKLTDQERSRILQIAKRAYITLGCSGLARVDFLKSKDKLFVSEVNTIPGFTSTSKYPRLMMATGMTYQELITQLIELALED